MANEPGKVKKRAANAIGGDKEASANSDNGSSVRTLLRGLRILRCFDVDHPEWGLAEISRHTDLHKATAYRLVKTIEREGFLAFDRTTGKYHLGPSMLRAAYLTLSQTELLRKACPHMESLAATTGETVDLAIWTDKGALLVGQVLTSNPFKPAIPVGRMFTGITSAHSKVLLAFAPESKRSEALAKPQEQLTEHTIVDPRALADELARVRREGVAYDLQEYSIGICAVGAPVRDLTGEVRASIAVVAPVERFGPNEMRRYAEAVRQAASALSQELGYRGDLAQQRDG